uniref:AC4 n=1 Tax=Chilli leaf curl Salem virus TaxID=3145020 RepID=A0AB38ZLS2_9GEMI
MPFGDYYIFVPSVPHIHRVLSVPDSQWHERHRFASTLKIYFLLIPNVQFPKSKCSN